MRRKSYWLSLLALVLIVTAAIPPALAYLTGILPIVRDKVQSKLNNFEEYTVLDPGELAEYVGFTDEEVRRLKALG